MCEFQIFDKSLDLWCIFFKQFMNTFVCRTLVYLCSILLLSMFKNTVALQLTRIASSLSVLTYESTIYSQIYWGYSHPKYKCMQTWCKSELVLPIDIDHDSLICKLQLRIILSHWLVYFLMDANENYCDWNYFLIKDKKSNLKKS